MTVEYFEKRLKKLSKKYKRIVEDYKSLIEKLENNPGVMQFQGLVIKSIKLGGATSIRRRTHGIPEFTIGEKNIGERKA